VFISLTQLPTPVLFSPLLIKETLRAAGHLCTYCEHNGGCCSALIQLLI
jgi:hypothetical protein